ncbi:kinesin-like protein KIF27 [Bemisia tabaci]|uniref:kinesin-like protein KIF27 n=1 Tax=Bemisia tabaci TaxID=7038 RepID=UPI003B28C120
MHLSSYNFTTTQLLKLVSNAEGLLQKLADTHIPAEYQCEINEWLCLKQECEEVLSSVASNSAEEDDENIDDSDASSSVKSEKGKRGLGPIPEVTENEVSSFSGSSGSERNRSIDYGYYQKFEKPVTTRNNSDYCNNNINNNISNNHNPHSRNHSLVIDPEPSNLNFTVVFDNYYPKFRQITETKIRHEKNSLDDRLGPKNLGNNKLRRKSICAAEDPLRNPDYVSAPDKKMVIPELAEEMSPADCEDIRRVKATSAVDVNLIGEPIIGMNKNEVTDVVPLQDSKSNLRDSLGIVDPVKELQYIVSYNESKKNTICLMYIDINEAKKRLAEFHKVVKLKAKLLQKIVKNADAAIQVQRKCELKLSKLEGESGAIKSRLAKFEKNLLYNERGNMNDIAKLKNSLMTCESKLKDMKIIHKIARDCQKNIMELERTLHFSKKKMQKLAKSLKLEDRQESEMKDRREAFVHEDAKTKLNRLLLEQLLKQNSENFERKERMQSQLQQAEKEYQGHILKSLGVIKEASNSFKKSKEDSANFIVHKGDNLGQDVLRGSKTDASSVRGLTESCKSESQKEDKSATKVTFEDGGLKGIKELCWRITQLENVIRENACATESANVSKSKEVLRHEIRNLRRTKECLIEERDKLSNKMKSKSSSSSEKRMFYEVDESIDAVDFVIEHKNELLCGRSGLELKDKDALKFEIMLLARLSNLSLDEMRSLLYRYFWKVVDLRESSKSLEEQITEMDIQYESIAMKFQRLVNDIQYNDVLSELKLTLMQKDYEEKIGSLLRHLCELEAILGKAEEMETNYNIENVIVQRDEDALDPYVPRMHHHGIHQRPRIPTQFLHQTHSNSNRTSTKVTKEGNKLIFCQEKKRSN